MAKKLKLPGINQLTNDKDFFKYLNSLEQVDPVDWLKNPKLAADVLGTDTITDPIQELINKDPQGIADFFKKRQDETDVRFKRTRKIKTLLDGNPIVLPNTDAPITNTIPTSVMDARTKLENAARGTKSTLGPIAMAPEFDIPSALPEAPVLPETPAIPRASVLPDVPVIPEAPLSIAPKAPPSRLSALLSKVGQNPKLAQALSRAGLFAGTYGAYADVNDARDNFGTMLNPEKSASDRAHGGFKGVTDSVAGGAGLTAAMGLLPAAAGTALASAAVPALLVAGGAYAAGGIADGAKSLKDMLNVMDSREAKELAEALRRGDLDGMTLEKKVPKIEPPVIAPPVEEALVDVPPVEEAPVDDVAPDADDEANNNFNRILDAFRASDPGYSMANQENLGRAQEASNFNNLIAIMNKAGAQVGSGIAGLGAGAPVKIEDAFDALSKNADVPVTQYDQAVKNEKFDKDSEYSRMYRDMTSLMLQDLGIKDPSAFLGNSSAEQLEKILPQLRTLAEGKDRRQAAVESKRELVKQRLSDRITFNNQRHATKLESGFAASTLGKQHVTNAQRNLARVKNLFGTFGIDNEAPIDEIDRQVNQKTGNYFKQLDAGTRLTQGEAAIELASMLSGSNQAAASTIQGLELKSASKDIRNIKTWFTNTLSPIKQAEYARDILKIAVRVKDNSNATIANSRDLFIKSQKAVSKKDSLHKTPYDEFPEFFDSFDATTDGFRTSTGEVQGLSKYPKTLVNLSLNTQAEVFDKAGEDYMRAKGYN